jgi:vacuolar protein sorting-associated protein 13A/C
MLGAKFRYKPPSIGLVLWDTNEDGGGGLFAKPEKFEKQGYLKDDIAFWLPVAPSGYVSLGCVATTSSSPDRDLQNIVRCVRSDLVMGTDFASCITNTSSIKHRAAELSIWPVENKVNQVFGY